MFDLLHLTENLIVKLTDNAYDRHRMNYGFYEVMLASRNLLCVCHWGRQWGHKDESAPSPPLSGKIREQLYNGVCICHNRVKYRVS